MVRWRRDAFQFFRVLCRGWSNLIVAVIHLSGWSSILFVASIFVFVFWQAFIVIDDGGISLWTEIDVVEFFTSTNWRPESPVKHEYGILALLVGSVSVTLLAMAIAVPLGLGAAVYISEFCHGQGQGDAEDHDRALGGNSVDRVGIHRRHGARAADRCRNWAPIGE